MKEKNKVFAVGIIIFFLLLEIIPSTSIGLSNMNNQQLLNKVENFEEITIYRFGLDKSIKPIVQIKESKDANDVSTKVAEKCRELCKNDFELQKFIDSENIFFTKVESKGKGIHFAIFRPMLRFKPVLRASIFYRYFYEEDYTKADNNTLAQGPQKGSIIGFIGYAGFSTRIIGYTVIYGYSIFRVNVKQIG